jgi:hypothetical protein
MKISCENKGVPGQEHPIFYIDESWVDRNLIFRKCWKNEEVMGVQANVNPGNRLIMLHVGGINGFLPNAALVRLEVQRGTNMVKGVLQILGNGQSKK